LRPLKGTSAEALPEFLRVDCLVVRAFNPFYPPRDEDRHASASQRARHLNEVCAPAPAVARRLWQLPPGSMSVHIRRTDHVKAITRSPDELFLDAMDACLFKDEDATFFLATDDPEVEAAMRHRFGNRLLTQRKRTLDRNSPEGIEDALLDLLLLAQGEKVIGSFRSSFSAMASHFRMVPLQIVVCTPERDGNAQPKPAFREVSVVAADPADKDAAETAFS
ncbi:unnamed protein product, partial [Polarella glacialis]